MEFSAQSQAKPLTIGVEVSDAATRLTAVVDPSLDSRRWHTRLPAPPAPVEAVARIAELVQRVATETHAPHGEAASSGFAGGLGAPALASVGIAVAGEVDAAAGVIHALPPSSAWAGFPLRDELVRALGRGSTIRLASTTEAAALAEARLGAGAGYTSVFYAALSRTVMSALVVAGQVLRGEHGAAGQLGHIQVRTDGPRCRCAALGHLDPIASAQSIVRAMIGRASGSDESTAAMLRVTSGRAEAMSAAQVIQLATDGDPAAGAVVADVFDALATALADVIALLDPGVIVVDGPLVEAGEAFFDPLRKALEARCSQFATVPALVRSHLYPSTALLGARLLASLDAP